RCYSRVCGDGQRVLKRPSDRGIKSNINRSSFARGEGNVGGWGTCDCETLGARSEGDTVDCQRAWTGVGGYARGYCEVAAPAVGSHHSQIDCLIRKTTLAV